MYIFTIILAVGVSIYVLYPLMVPASERLLATEAVSESAIGMMKNDKDLYLHAIKDIDFEYASDKINDEDYKNLKDMYSMKAYNTMEKIKELENSDETTSSETKASDETKDAQGDDDE